MSKFKLMTPIYKFKETEGLTLTYMQKLIIENRVNEAKMKQFNYKVEDLYNNKFDPTKNIELLMDLDKGGEIIAKGITKGKRILLASDMDADGVNSASVMHVSFRDIFKASNFKSIINRRLDGNGFNKTFVKRILDIHSKWPIDIMVTADHGSSDEEAYKVLKAAGIKTIVLTDHHTIPKNNYPHSADVVINPHREGNKYYRDVSGCFVAYLTMLATMKHLRGDYHVNDFNKVLPYVAISTISDVMALDLPINRQVVKRGLHELNSFRDPVWMGIKRVLKINNRINSTDIGFKIAPLLNTANRLDKEILAFYLLTSENIEESLSRASELNKLNLKRKGIQKQILKEALFQAKELPQINSLVVSVQTPHAVNGIVAGNLGDQHNKPCVCFIDDEKTEFMTGSGRAILSNLDLVQMYNNINNNNTGVLTKFGGHKLAAGCQIHKNKLDLFRTEFEKEVTKALAGKKPDTTIYYDAYLKPDEITPYFVNEIDRLHPYGKNWTRPIFVSKLKINFIMLLGKVGAKIRFSTPSGMEIDSTHFFKSKGSEIDINNIKQILKYGDNVEVAYHIGISTFNDVIKFELEIVDLVKIV